MSEERESGRSGGTRTPDRRFWRPLLYQLSYTPAQIAGYQFRFLRAKALGRPSDGRSATRMAFVHRYADYDRAPEREFFGGDRGIRTPDLCDANAALSQLSYIPTALGL
jgi:hypothetical protein